jgi:hypothetical protein
MLHLFLATALTSPSLAVDLRPVPSASVWRSDAVVTSHEAACDDGTAGGTLVQQQVAWYGNRLTPPCAGARIIGASLAHFGYGLPGPYEFRLHLLDAACRQIGVTPVLTIDGAPDTPATASINLSDFEWCTEGAFHLLLEPLTCADGSQGGDCFPAVIVDASSDADATEHCGVVSTAGAAGRQCLAPRSADGRFFDFGLRVQVACAAPACATAVELVPWGLVKRIYSH